MTGINSVEAALPRLFGEGVEISAVTDCVTPPPLHPLEARAVAGASPKRRAEFARGRMCAKRAIEKLIGGACILPRAPDGIPAWPDGVVGSISHCEDLCCAVVGATARWRSLGVDAENYRPITDNEATLIMTENERAFCNAKAIDPSIVFGAKEAFYKCYFPLFRRFLHFRDVELEIEQTTPLAGSFHARLRSADLPGAQAARLVRGAWSRRGAFLLAGAALARP